MSIPQSEVTHTQLSSSKGVITHAEAIKHYWQHERNLRISYHLQTHLDITQIVHAFAEILITEIYYDSLAYHHPDIKQHLIIGKEKAHALSYKLTFEDTLLGTINLTRNTRFTGSEVAELEEILCTLIYPLHNGLQYYHALQSSTYDVLTGAINRNSLQDSLRHEWELAHRHNSPLALLVIDIDHFKLINDTYGHICGDLILKCIAEKIHECARESDLVYRYGGDEFTVILRETNEEGALILAERIRQLVEHSIYAYKDEILRLTISIGVSCNQHCHNVNEIDLLENADNALYRAKNQGRNLVEI